MARGVNATQTRMFVAPTVARRGESSSSPDSDSNSTPYTTFHGPQSNLEPKNNPVGPPG